MLLAYLDGEISMARIRMIRNHLKICWNCRSVLADLESQAEAVSRLLTTTPDSEVGRLAEATEKFLRWRESLEKRNKYLFRSQHPLLLGSLVRVAFLQTEADAPLSLTI